MEPKGLFAFAFSAIALFGSMDAPIPEPIPEPVPTMEYEQVLGYVFLGLVLTLVSLCAVFVVVRIAFSQLVMITKETETELGKTKEEIAERENKPQQAEPSKAEHAKPTDADLNEKNAEREAKNAEREAKNAEREAKNAEREAKNAEREAKNAEREAKNAEREEENFHLKKENFHLKKENFHLKATKSELEEENCRLEATLKKTIDALSALHSRAASLSNDMKGLRF